MQQCAVPDGAADAGGGCDAYAYANVDVHVDGGDGDSLDTGYTEYSWRDSIPHCRLEWPLDVRQLPRLQALPPLDVHESGRDCATDVLDETHYGCAYGHDDWHGYEDVYGHDDGHGHEHEHGDDYAKLQRPVVDAL